MSSWKDGEVDWLALVGRDERKNRVNGYIERGRVRARVQICLNSYRSPMVRGTICVLNCVGIFCAADVMFRLLIIL